MERLTVRNSDGTVSQPLNLRWADALDRLAAYEDTGLAPEDIDGIIERGTPPEGGTVELLWEYLTLGSLGHLHELVEAERDGRLVVLPCKKGDELWSYCSLRDIDARGVFSLVVSSVFILDGCVRIKTGRYGEYGVEEIGKTLFRTREEAEAALEKFSLGEGVQMP